MSPVRTGPVAGFIVQIVLLAALSAVAGLGPAGALVGTGYGAVVCVALARGLRRSAPRRTGEGRLGHREPGGMGPADRVTLARATLVGGVAALVADSFTRPVPVPVLVGLAIVALVLDGVDGAVARRTGTVSPLGARFDMEVDAFLLLVLGAYLVPAVGAWVLAIGAMRYVFVAAMWVLPFMRAPLPARFWRKVAAATQGIVLTITASGGLPRALAIAAPAAALALLVESFGHDIGWLWRQRRRTPTVAQLSAVAPSPAVPDRPEATHGAAGRVGWSFGSGAMGHRAVVEETPT